MLKLTLIAIGDKMPAWVEAGFDDYAKRVHGRCQINVQSIPARKRGKNADIPRIIKQESNDLLAAIPKGALVVALDRSGRSFSSEQLAEKLNDWMSEVPQVVFLVGGPEGLTKEVLATCQLHWSFSALTFSHPVVRVVWAEQMYRAWSILEGMPYHR